MESTLSSRTRNRGLGGVVGLVVLLVCLLVSGFLIINRQYVIDKITAWQYDPPKSIIQITKNAHLSEHGKFYFYASQPVLEATQAFNSECERKEKHSAILGCYVNQRIYIFDVQNKLLDGVEEVSAAHEMLHAAWERLSQSERDRLKPLLEKAYKKVADDELRTRMDYYSRTQPGERSNELHSIIGTEHKNIGPELEAYYSQYFDDRAALVDIYKEYEQIFVGIENKSTDLKSQLETLGKEIETLSAGYSHDVETLNQDIKQFNQRAESGYFASTTAFYDQRADLVARTDSLSGRRKQINQKIERYDQLLAELQKVSIKAETLNRSLDSTLAPAPTI